MQLLGEPPETGSWSLLPYDSNNTKYKKASGFVACLLTRHKSPSPGQAPQVCSRQDTATWPHALSTAEILPRFFLFRPPVFLLLIIACFTDLWACSLENG